MLTDRRETLTRRRVQTVNRQVPKPCVAGSNPAGGTVKPQVTRLVAREVGWVTEQERVTTTVHGKPSAASPPQKQSSRAARASPRSSSPRP